MSSRTLVAAAAFLLSMSCSKPEPPVLTPKQVTVTGISLTGVDFRMRVDAFNPNSIDLTAQAVTGTVTVEGKHGLGSFTLQQGLALPAKATTPIDVPLSAKWKSLGDLAMLAGTKRPVAYSIDGIQTIGGKRLNLDLPFHVEGTITHEELAKAALSSLPAIPGIGLPSFGH